MCLSRATVKRLLNEDLGLRARLIELRLKRRHALLKRYAATSISKFFPHLEVKACSTRHLDLESLKASLTKTAAKLDMILLRAERLAALVVGLYSKSRG